MTPLSTTLSTSDELSVEKRTLQAVTFEIKSLHTQAQQMMLNYAIEIGRRLTEAKAMLEHGAWGEWLKNEVAFSKSTANNLMRIFEEYGDRQMNLFGAEAKSQSLGNLPYTKALKLLAMPEEEREDFIEEHPVESMSSRELEKAIKERNQAQAETQQILTEKEEVQAEYLSLQQKTGHLEESAQDALEHSRRLQDELELLRNTPKEITTIVDQTAVENAREEVTLQLQQELETLLSAKDEAERQAKQAQEQLLKLSQEQTTENTQLLEILEQEKEDALARAEALTQQLKEQPSTDVAVFKVHFTQVQEHINKLVEIVKTTEDIATSEKLCNALLRVLESSIEAVID